MWSTRSSLSLIANNFIPPEERNKVEGRATYDAEHDTWRIEQPSVQSVHAKRPVSAVPNSKRPASAVARAANRLGSENPRFKGENILRLELDMPERTPPLPPRTKWTRRVPHPVLIGHAASLSQVPAPGEGATTAPACRLSMQARPPAPPCHGQRGRGSVQ